MLDVQLVGTSSGSFGNLGTLGSLGVYNGPLKKDAGGQFNCTTNACYAIGGTVESVFKSLQKNLNRFAAPVGFRKLVVNGFIGDQTVAAVAATSKFLKAGPGSVLKSVADGPNRQLVAMFADELTKEIKASADVLDLKKVSAPKPTPAQKAEIAATQEEKSGAGDGGGDFTWAWWALGGLAAVGVVAVGVSMARRHSAGGGSGALFPHSSY